MNGSTRIIRLLDVAPMIAVICGIALVSVGFHAKQNSVDMRHVHDDTVLANVFIESGIETLTLSNFDGELAVSEDGSIAHLSQETYHLEIEANLQGEDVSSVVFAWSEDQGDNEEWFTDSEAPFVFSPSSENLNGSVYTVTATAYTEPGGAGSIVNSLGVVVDLHQHRSIGANSISRVLQEGGATTVLQGGWARNPDYPIDIWVGESQGGLVGEDLVVVGGFVYGWGTTRMVRALNLYDPSAEWRSLTDFPYLDEAPTHAGFVVVGKRFYMCGGYKGMHPGPEMDECFVLDLTNGDPGVWDTLPSLPERRGGGSMTYMSADNSLVFALGADRPFAGSGEAFDHRDAWTLSLDDVDAGWTRITDVPYEANHVSATTIKDCSGNEHIIFAGGQLQEQQQNGNLDENFELSGGEWIARANLPRGRGHTASSTIPYACGLLMIGGSYNSGDPTTSLRTSDIHYYDYDRDEWTLLGTLPRNQNSPVCDVALDVDGKDYLFCGLAYTPRSYLREISYSLSNPPSPPGPTPGATPAPTQMPTPAPTPNDESLGPLYKLNCGGSARGDWESDGPYVVNGRAVDRTNFLSNRFDPEGPDFIYLTERHDTAVDIVYDFPDVPNGVYVIEFLFAEVQGVIRSGDRIFSFSAEGMAIPEITDFDIYAQVGFAVPITVEVEVTVSDDDGLQIESSVTADDAKINGLIITPKSGGPDFPATPTAAPVDVPTGTATESPVAPPTAAGEILYKINCGGVVDPLFPEWEVDDAYTSSGRSITRSRFGSSRPNYSDLFMYNTERHDVSQDPIGYEFPVEDGTYDIAIYWMEAQDVGVGDRTMDVFVEGSVLLSEFDIFDYADGELGNGVGARNTPFIYTIPSVAVSDGSLSISFAAVLDDAKVNGIVITKQ